MPRTCTIQIRNLGYAFIGKIFDDHGELVHTSKPFHDLTDLKASLGKSARLRFGVKVKIEWDIEEDPLMDEEPIDETLLNQAPPKPLPKPEQAVKNDVGTQCLASAEQDGHEASCPYDTDEPQNGTIKAISIVIYDNTSPTGTRRRRFTMKQVHDFLRLQQVLGA